MLLCFFLFTPVQAAAPTEAPSYPSSNTVLIGQGPTRPHTPPSRTNVRETVLSPREEIDALVRQISGEYGVSADEMVRVINCENDTWNPRRQSEVRYKPGNRWGIPAGTYEKSYGLAMIHLPDHPDVSYEEATDPEFALTFMAKKFSEGKQRMWSCY